MPTRSIRKEHLPKNAVVLTGETTIPEDFTYVSALSGFFLKGTCSANPGSSAGANSHIDPTVNNCHTHSTVTVESHTHTIQWGDGTPVLSTGYGSTGTDFIRNCHTHPDIVTGGTSTTATAGSNINQHFHDSTEATPPYTTMHLMKKGANISMRKKRNSSDYTLISKNNLACLTKYSIDSNTYGKFIRVTSSVGATPYETGGACTHVHDQGGAHQHSITIANHTHALSGNTAAETVTGDDYGTCSNGSAVESTKKGHVHSLACKVTGNPICIATIQTAETEGVHTHAAANHLPPYTDVAFVKRSIISIRENGISQGEILGWMEALACVPTGWQLGNGTNGTLDLRNKYLRGAAACANPGGTGGATTHTHASVTHTHSQVQLPHKHTTSSLSITGYSPTANYDSGSSTQHIRPQLNHVHNAIHPSGEANPTATIPAGGSHNHGAVSNDPSHKIIAWIEKL